jgi:hypothetical protein
MEKLFLFIVCAVHIFPSLFSRDLGAMFWIERALIG